MKIVTVLGARPQFIKAAMLSRILRDSPVSEVIIHTGQHYDQKMSDVFFDEMQIPRPDHFLQVNSKYHGEMTGKMLEGVEKILLSEKPDRVLVYGDTNTTLAGSLAASKLHIPIAHVEAGLRSFNMKMPEEINRILTDRVSEWLFTPTANAVDNLLQEGFKKNKIYPVGDIMYDAVLFYRRHADQFSSILKTLNLMDKRYILATIHRAENTNDQKRLTEIFDQLFEISKEKTIVLPLHPRTKSLLKKDYTSKNFIIIDPVGYFDMISLQKNCQIVVTDSGGLQKEAFFNQKYCITVREETEWVELVTNGFNFLSNPVSSMSSLVEELWDKPFEPKDKGSLYGDGSTAEKIASILNT